MSSLWNLDAANFYPIALSCQHIAYDNLSYLVDRYIYPLSVAADYHKKLWLTYVQHSLPLVLLLILLEMNQQSLIRRLQQ
jgi:hypothetical protein